MELVKSISWNQLPVSFLNYEHKSSFSNYVLWHIDSCQTEQRSQNTLKGAKNKRTTSDHPHSSQNENSAYPVITRDVKQ